MLPRSPRTLFAVSLAAALVASDAAAQQPVVTPTGRLGIGVRVQTKTINATVAEVSRRGLIVETDEGNQPVPMNRGTDVRIEGRGDAGFLQPGAVVNAWGTLKPDGRLAEADMRVHVEPNKTLAWGRTINVYDDDPTVSFVGRIVSLEPLVVQAMDTFVPTMRNPQGGPGQQGRAMRNAPITLDLYVKQPEEVNVCFGTDLSMAAPGDEVAVMIREDNPRFAARVTVRKSEVATSPAKRQAEAAGGEGADGEKEGAKGDGDTKE